MYIHIPFCLRKCLYCDFVSYAGKEKRIPAYFEALQREIEWYARNELFTNYQPYTLYIGGGTPSLAGDELTQWFVSQYQLLSPVPLAESTVEVNPGTVTAGQLTRFRKAGFNRLSIGVQSFDPQELRELGRIHTPEEALSCFYQAREAGFSNLNLDLIFGIPGSTVGAWENSLKRATSLNPEHIALYNLTIEAGTPFWEQRQQGRLLLPDEDMQLEMYETGRNILLEAGYEHYEISNFARPGYRSRHNQIYWRNEEYLGLGTGAHSYLKGHRYWNTTDPDTYIEACFYKDKSVTKNEPVSYPETVEGEECLRFSEKIGETVIMNLRLLEGIDLPAFSRRFGCTLDEHYATTIAKLESLELVVVQENHLRLTPRGVLLSNEVFQEFINSERSKKIIHAPSTDS